MRRNKRLQEEFDLLGAATSAVRSVAELPIIRDVVNFFSGLAGGEEVEQKKEEIKQSIEGLEGERVPLSKALELDTDKIALVVGSSQAGVIGYPVMKELESRGFKNFKFNSTPAKSMNFIYASVAAGVREKGTYDAIVIFPGFRGSENPEDVVSIIELFEPARCFVVIPPPVTEITDTLRASGLGLNAGRPVPPDYWFLVGGGKFAGRREDFCRDLVERVKSAGATPIDPRDVVSGGSDTLAEGIQPTGVSFPNSPDGIHPSSEVCGMLAKAVGDAIFQCQLTVSSADVIKHIKPVDLSRNPSIAQKLSDYPALSTIVGAAATAQLSPESAIAVPDKLKSFDYNLWTKQIAAIEGKYQSVNRDSLALGKYQFVPSIWWDRIRSFAGGRLPSHNRIGEKYEKPWFEDYQAFLDNPGLQEDWMRYYTESFVVPAVAALRKDLPDKTANRSDGQLAALIHFQGPTGSRDWLSSGIMRGREQNAIDPDQYMSRIA